MKRNPYEDMKALYPPTPPAFSRRIDSAILALPERGARWKLPVPAVAGYAAAACVALALVLSGAIIPVSLLGGAKAQPTTSSYPSSGPEATASFPAWQDTRYSVAPAATVAIPTAEPLPQLPVVENAKSPTSADGWQVAAVDGNVTWHYHPTGNKLAFTADGKTTAIALDLKSGQSVDTYTFVPGQNGQWLAFTVHQTGGDTVWLVIGNGRKMVVPDDVRWVDANGNLVRFNLAGASMITVQYLQYLPGHIAIYARFSDGDLYIGDITLNSDIESTSLLMDKRTGVYAFLARQDGNEPLITNNIFVYEMKQDKNGKETLSFGGRQYQTELKNNQFSFFRLTNRQATFYQSRRALLVYRDDPSRTLWELNIITGKVTAVATGCVAADWIDDKTYWYSTSADTAVVLKKEASGLNTVESELTFEWSAYPTPDDTQNKPSCPAVQIWLNIKNNTASDIIVPENIPCSLRVHSKNNVIYSLGPTYALSAAASIDIKDKKGIPSHANKGPVTLHPGDTLTVYSNDIPLGYFDNFIIEGSFYDVNTIYFEHSNNIEDTIPTGVSITGKIKDDGCLLITIDNQSRATLMLSQDSAGYSDYTSHKLRYQLLKGGEVIDSGSVKMNIKEYCLYGVDSMAISAKQMISFTNIPPSGMLSISENEVYKRFASLAPGEYTLQCCMDTYQQNGALPWGYASGYYFNVPFTKK